MIDDDYPPSLQWARQFIKANCASVHVYHDSDNKKRGARSIKSMMPQKLRNKEANRAFVNFLVFCCYC